MKNRAPTFQIVLICHCILLMFCGCNHVIEVQFFIKNATPYTLEARYYSRIIYDSVDHLLPPMELWALDGRRVPLPRKSAAQPSFERDRRFVFGRIWNDSVHLKKNINWEQHWELVKTGPDAYEYHLHLDTSFFSP